MTSGVRTGDLQGSTRPLGRSNRSRMITLAALTTAAVRVCKLAIVSVVTMPTLPLPANGLVAVRLTIWRTTTTRIGILLSHPASHVSVLRALQCGSRRWLFSNIVCWADINLSRVVATLTTPIAINAVMSSPLHSAGRKVNRQ